jgi:ubiquinone/menaquinone biosynthesis C-methylase UbiE
VPEYEPHSVRWTPEKVSRYWDFFAAHQADQFHSAFYRRSLGDLVQRQRPRLFVDIGCGTGDLVVEVSRRGIRAVGIDTSPELLERGRASAIQVKVQPEFRLGSALALPFEAATVDAASLIEVIEHLDEEVIDGFLAEARRVIRPGGVLIVTTPNEEDLAARTVQCPDCGCEFHAIQHERSWTQRQLADRLRARGFDPRVRATRLVEDGPWHERAARYMYYRLARLKPHLVAIATVR